MTKYYVFDSNGQKHFIFGPDGATPEQVVAQAQGLIPNAQNNPGGYLSNLWQGANTTDLKNASKLDPLADIARAGQAINKPIQSGADAIMDAASNVQNRSQNPIWQAAMSPVNDLVGAAALQQKIGAEMQLPTNRLGAAGMLIGPLAKGAKLAKQVIGGTPLSDALGIGQGIEGLESGLGSQGTNGGTAAPTRASMESLPGGSDLVKGMPNVGNRNLSQGEISLLMQRAQNARDASTAASTNSQLQSALSEAKGIATKEEAALAGTQPPPLPQEMDKLQSAVGQSGSEPSGTAKFGGQLARVYSGTPVDSGTAAINDLAMLERAPSDADVTKAYTEFEKAHGLTGLRAQMRNDWQNLKAPELEKLVLDTARKVSSNGFVGKNQLYQASQGARILRDMASKGDQEAIKAINGDLIEKGKGVIDAQLEKLAPGYQRLRTMSFENDVLNDFSHPLPQNQNMGPNALRALWAGSNLGLAAGMAMHGNPAGAMVPAMGAALVSPMTWKGMINNAAAIPRIPFNIGNSGLGAADAGTALGNVLGSPQQ